MSWLVTGGAGYIGSHVVHAMTAAGHRLVVVDDLSTGKASRLPTEVTLVRGSVLDRPMLEETMKAHGISGVLHFAARKQVNESVAQPLLYYETNVHGTLTILKAAVAAGVRKFVFSSSAAVYGMPDVELVTEETPCVPINPYGESKLAGEWMVSSVGAAHGMATACLRYFNVAGAASPALSDDSVSNLVPMVFQRLQAGARPRLFGSDYPTPDGSCIRDFVHVSDVATAHVAAAERLLRTGSPMRLTLNIGRGEGVSVREMLRVIRQVTGRDTEPALAPRRPGDAARVVASADRIRAILGWTATHSIEEMVASAWEAWQARHPNPLPTAHP